MIGDIDAPLKWIVFPLDLGLLQLLSIYPVFGEVVRMQCVNTEHTFKDFTNYLVEVLLLGTQGF